MRAFVSLTEERQSHAAPFFRSARCTRPLFPDGQIKPTGRHCAVDSALAAEAFIAGIAPGQKMRGRRNPRSLKASIETTVARRDL
ncbi:MAG: hypothetical protein AB1745_16400, partial [Pseudomonadota bacterium]